MHVLNKEIEDIFDFSAWQWILTSSFNAILHRPFKKVGLDSFLDINHSLDACILLWWADHTMTAAPVPYSSDFILRTLVMAGSTACYKCRVY